jgi:5-methylthioadenosine/S-adenosylhomocysteine deaminase
MRTLLRGRWVVGFDGREHRLIDHGLVVYEDDRILAVGRQFEGSVDRELDAGPLALICPGFVNIHSHSGSHVGTKLIADFGRPELFGCGYLNYSTPGSGQQAVAEDPVVGARCYVWELLRNGTTTALDVGPSLAMAEQVVAQAAELGLRVYLGPGFADTFYSYDQRGVVQYTARPELGRQLLAAAVDFIRRHDSNQGGRVRGLLVAAQVDTNSAELLRAARAAADELGVLLATHVGQNIKEFHRLLQTTGKTPVAFLEEVGFLGPDAVLGHCIYTAEHPWVGYPGEPDLPRLVAAGASVGHCPNAYARRGLTMISFDRYRGAGLNVGLGTDTYPRDLIAEMRWAATTNKLVEGNVLAAPAAAVFNAATLAGAKALGRDDLGRLAPGAKADLVVIDLANPRLGPIRDPIQVLVESASGDDVTTVVVDGRTVVEQGQLPGVDPAALSAAVQRSAEAYWAAYQGWDYAGQSADQRFPRAFAAWPGP